MKYAAIPGQVPDNPGEFAVKVPLAVLAEYANTTADFKLNIMGIFDTIFGKELPVIVPSMRLVIQLQANPEEWGRAFTFTIKMIDGDGNELLPYPLQRQFLPKDIPLRTHIPQIVELQGVSFERFGPHEFIVLLNDEEKARIPFSVRPSWTPSAS